MSQENIELSAARVRSLARGGPEAVVDFWDPEIELWLPSGMIQAGGTYRGRREAVLGWMTEWAEAWEEIEYTPEEFTERVTPSSSASSTKDAGRGAGPELRAGSGTCSSTTTEGFGGGSFTRNGRRPSKPWGCGSKRRPSRRGGSARRSPLAEPRSNSPGGPFFRNSAGRTVALQWNALVRPGRFALALPGESESEVSGPPGDEFGRVRRSEESCSESSTPNFRRATTQVRGRAW